MQLCLKCSCSVRDSDSLKKVLEFVPCSRGPLIFLDKSTSLGRSKGLCLQGMNFRASPWNPFLHISEQVLEKSSNFLQLRIQWSGKCFFLCFSVVQDKISKHSSSLFSLWIINEFEKKEWDAMDNTRDVEENRWELRKTKDHLLSEKSPRLTQRERKVHSKSVNI